MLPKDLSKEKKIPNLKIKSITVRTDEINFLTGIKVELMNGFSSPDYRATDHGNTQTTPTIHKVDEFDVSGVSIKVHKDSNGYQFYENLVLLQDTSPGYTNQLIELNRDKQSHKRQY